MSEKIKFPRTFHFPNSLGASSDDKKHHSTAQWEGMEVVVTEKLDGENSSLYHDGLHARSLDYNPHPSRTFLKSLWGNIHHNIPKSIRICGENISAVHSIKYDNLSSYFFVFGVWECLKCLSWDDTLEYAELLNLEVVPTLYKGPWYEGLVDNLVKGLDLNVQEGLVLRPTQEFQYVDYAKLVGKWVRTNHVQSSTHWKYQEVKFNGLKEKNVS